MKRSIVPLNGKMVMCVLAFATAHLFATAFADTTLTADANWTGSETTALTGRINLNGHKLTVSNLTGKCEIVNGVNEDYALLDSITSTGTQWINTGYKPNMDTRVDAKFRPTACNSGSPHYGYGEFFSCTSDDGDPSCSLTKSGLPKAKADAFRCRWGGGEKKINGFFHDQEGTITVGSSLVNADCTVRLDKSGFALNGQEVTFSAPYNYTGALNLYIFGCNCPYTWGGVENKAANDLYRPQPMKLYFLTITESGVVKRDFLPAKQLSSGKIGLWDRQNNVFYPNNGSGAFTAGTQTNTLSNIVRDLGALHVDLPSGGLPCYDVRFGEGAALAVTNKAVTLKGNLTFEIPSALEPGIYMLIAADEVVVKDGAVLAATRSDGTGNYTLDVSANGLCIRIAPAYAKIDATSGEWKFYKGDGQACSGWDGGITSEIDVRFSTAAEAAMLATKTAEFANANAVLLDANIELAAAADWSAFEFDMNGHTINLKGNALRMKRLAGNGTITDSTARVEEYELLDSITSTGTQWINTGYKPNMDTRVDAKFRPTALDSSKYGEFFSCTSDDGDPNCSLTKSKLPKAKADAFRCRWGGANTTINGFFHDQEGTIQAGAGSSFLNVDCTVRLDKSGFALNGQEVKFSAPYNYTGALNLYIFGCNCLYTWGGKENTAANDLYRPQPMKLYSLTITESGVVKRDFLPAKQLSSGKIGLWDRQNNVFYPNNGSGTFTAGTVTNYIHAYTAGTPDTPGELHVEVAAGTTENTTVELSGNIRFVKEGAGTFVAAKTGQTYFGGTEVAAGTFKVAADDEKANRFAGAAGNVVTVDTGATLDVNGNPGFDMHPLVLAGGTLTNGAAAAPAVLGAVTLTASSTVNPGGGITNTTDIALGDNGYTLAVNLPVGKSYDLAAGARFTGTGTVNVTSGGYIRFLGTAARDMSTVNLILSCALQVDADITVNDLNIPYTWGNQYAGGDGHICIKGTFTPSSPEGYHRNCVMLDGSTLNLSGKEGVWPLEPNAPTSGTQMCNALAFAENATVTVSLGGRKVKNGPIVSWQTANKPSGTVRFVQEPNLNARLVLKPDGLWLQTGIAIRIR